MSLNLFTRNHADRMTVFADILIGFRAPSPERSTSDFKMCRSRLLSDVGQGDMIGVPQMQEHL